MKLAQATPSGVYDAWAEAALSVSRRPYIADVANTIVDNLHHKFQESLVLTRAFLTIPYAILPERQQRIATDLARAHELDSLLGPHTPVHSLLATCGELDEWNHPHKSSGHVAIPLLSNAFVESIPMMSRLLKELGLPLAWVQDPGSAMNRQMVGSDAGVFFVTDAVNATDEVGRKIIPAQKFVADYGVRSVFAIGGIVFGGAVLVLIFFSRDPIEPRVAKAFTPLVNHIKGLLISRCSMSRVFPPDVHAT